MTYNLNYRMKLTWKKENQTGLELGLGIGNSHEITIPWLPLQVATNLTFVYMCVFMCVVCVHVYVCIYTPNCLMYLAVNYRRTVC